MTIDSLFEILAVLPPSMRGRFFNDLVAGGAV